MRLFSILLAALAPLVSLSSLAEDARSFTYKSWFTSFDGDRIIHESYRLMPDENRIVYGGDAYHLAEFCTESESYFCFSDHLLAFAVPKSKIVQGQTWDYLGDQFNVVTCNLNFQLLTTEFKDICLIRSNIGKGMSSMEWLYSPVVGLIGFTEVSEDGKELRPSWIVGAAGFGAQIDTTTSHNKALNADASKAGAG